MFVRKLKGALLLGAVIWGMGASQVFAQGEDTRGLVEMLVKKGLLTNQEAADIVAKNRQNVNNDSGYKIKVASWIKELKLQGDARLRYEYREGQTEVQPGLSTSGGDTLARERFRYRLRFGATTVFTDEFSAGLRLETSTNPRSTNVTMGDDTGPFGKTSDGIFVGQLYVNWDPADWITLTGGRMPNPLTTTSMVWDADLNPEGAAERFHYNINDKLMVFANICQFLYDDVNPENGLGAGIIGRDTFLFVNQIGATYAFDKDTSVTLAPAFYSYTGGGDTFSTTTAPVFVGTTAANSVQVNDLAIVELPLEVKWLMFKQPWKFWTDVAVNADMGRRAGNAGQPSKNDEGLAYQIGVAVGSTKTKGGWEAKLFWEHKDLYSVDENLTDSDIFDSRLNMEGIVASVGYAFTDFLIGNITYGWGDTIDPTLPSSIGTVDITGVNPLTDYQILQLDLNWKF